ncbi:DUF5988 family protein [Micromonospora sp. LOL_025]|uniref:DUF5988 family protein n=1 Tax=Micromonospora sp. LOL_025 TaxID=3345413 RepID=UPI003A8B4154
MKVREGWGPFHRLITVERKGVEILFPDVIRARTVGEGTAMGHLADDNLVDVVLEGGPADLPPGRRLLKAVAAGERVKIEHYGGYEHFERQTGADPADDGAIAFRWTMRTRIAE